MTVPYKSDSHQFESLLKWIGATDMNQFEIRSNYIQTKCCMEFWCEIDDPEIQNPGPHPWGRLNIGRF